MRHSFPDTKMTKAKNNFIMFLGLGLIIIIACIFLFFEPSKPSPSISSETNAPTPIPSPVVTNTPNPTNSPTTRPSVKVPILSTSGWRTVSLQGIKFKVPPELTCYTGSSTTDKIDDNNCQSFTTDPRQVIRSRISVRPYAGGSRRQEYLGGNTTIATECRYLFVESKFGQIDALQIANDGGWCQGGGGAIIAVIGDKLVIFEELNYDSDTKIISRFPIRDTIISTLSSD